MFGLEREQWRAVGIGAIVFGVLLIAGAMPRVVLVDAPLYVGAVAGPLLAWVAAIIARMINGPVIFLSPGVTNNG